MENNTEQLLRDFLSWEDLKRREGKTVEALFEKIEALQTEQRKITEEHSAVMRAVKRMAKDRLADKAKLDVHGRAIKTLQQQVEMLTQRNPEVPDWRPNADEVTGVHALRDIARAQQELEERWEEDQKAKNEEATWWRRQGWIWAFAVVTLIVGSTLGGCVQYLIHQLEKEPPRAPAAVAPPATK